MAHNNHFFFKNLSPSPVAMPAPLKAQLDEAFGSIATLRRELVLTAAAMFGPGFVWLVKAGSHDYRVLATYLAGSPYAAAHWRRQDTDMNTHGRGGSAAPFLRATAQGAGGGGGARWGATATASGFSSGAALPPGGVDVVPLLCLNTWEHVWLRDYGIGGKRAFAEAWWEVVDWEAVAEAAAVTRPVAPRFR